MLLSHHDVERFYHILYALLAYTNRKLKIINNWRNPEDARVHTLREGAEIRNQFYEHPEVMRQFADENPFELPLDEIEIVRNWAHFVKGTFYVTKQLKDYAIFISEDKEPIAYGVTALTSTVDDTIDMDLPVMVQAVLLPFEGKIIYDSFLAPYRMSFGRGVRRTFDDAYQEAKCRHGVVTSLPFTPSEPKNADEEMLKHYLKSEENREMHWDDIQDILDRDPSLVATYHQEMGKTHARKLRRRLKDCGVRSAWFAILNGLIIASGTTEQEARGAAAGLVPDEKREHIHVFQHREGK